MTFFISGEDLWNVPARKVYAVTLENYEKKKRKTQRSNSLPGRKKRKFNEMDDALLEDMAEKLDKLVQITEVNEILVKSVKEVFKCCICFKTAQALTVSRCCQRLLGCGPCLTRWFEDNSYCPLCKSDEGHEKHFQLRGFDDFTTVINKLNEVEKTDVIFVILCDIKVHGHHLLFYKTCET